MKIQKKNNIVVLKKQKIYDALAILDKSEYPLIIFLDDLNKLIGTITDGDIRRYLLKNGKLDDFVIKAIKKKPTFFFKDKLDLSKVYKNISLFNLIGIISSIGGLIFSYGLEIKYKTDR